MKDPGNYPRWVLDVVQPGDVLEDDESLMRRAIAVAHSCIESTKGGPFGALLADDAGRIIAVGYNQVVPSNDSTAHAEMLVIRRAEQALGTFRLRDEKLPRLRLFTSCAPCIMCTGAIHWAGVPEVIAAARAEDVESIGFLEGPRNLDIPAFFAARDIAYRADVLRDEAREVIGHYTGPIYNG